MPLHLLGKKSWNVYNPANIARVKADTEAAAAREAAADQRMQERDAERRAAILRGQTPPPLLDDDTRHADRSPRTHGRRDKKPRKLRGEDDTDMDIRLAASITRPAHDDQAAEPLVKLRKPTSDAPLTDRAGNIDLFPVDIKEAVAREKKATAEKEKRTKEQAFADQYTMRFSNAAGKNGLDQPWYAAQQKPASTLDQAATAALEPEYPGLENKNVWGDSDPRRKEREQARISSNDPFAFMQKAQAQLAKSRDDRKKWQHERNRDLHDLRETQDKEERKRRRHRSNRSRSPGSKRTTHRHSHRRDRSRSPSRDQRRHGSHRASHHSTSRHRSRSPSSRSRRAAVDTT